MSGAGFIEIEALRSRVLMDVEDDFERLFCDGIINVYIRSGLQCD